MAEPNPRVTRRKVLAVKLETTKGTGVAADTHVLIYDPVLEADDTRVVRRPAGIYGGRSKSGRGEGLGTFSGRAELRSNGTTGLDAGLAILLQCCGWKLTTLTWSPSIVLSDQQTCSIQMYEDGVLKKLTGCHGSVSFSAMPGQPVNLEFNMRGVWAAVTDAALATNAIAATAPMRLASGSCSLDTTYKARVGSVKWGLNNAVAMHADVENAAGYNYGYTSDNDATVELDPLGHLVAEHDTWGKWLAGTAVALSLVVSDGTTKLTVAAPVLEIGQPKTADRDGLITHAYTGYCLHSSGNDQLTMVSAAV